MRWRLAVVVAACVVANALSGVAWAGSAGSGWPLPGTAPVVVAFGERYIAPDGTSAVHRGVDLAAPAGSAVSGVLEGTVKFAGRVPAGPGATTLAVTAESGDLRLTYLPLSEIAVTAGETIPAGSRVGTLAGDGDRSSPEPHLHLSARRGSLYIDPMPFLLVPPVAKGGSASEPVPAPALPQTAPVAPLASPSAVTEGSSIIAPQLQPTAVPVPANAPAEVSVNQPAPVDTVSTVNAPSVSRARSAEGVPANFSAALSAEAKTAAVPTPTGVPCVEPGESLSGYAATARDSRTGSRIPASAVPDTMRATLAADRRMEVLKSGRLSVGTLAGLAAALAVALLSPLWRSRPALGISVRPEREDVAAVVAR